MAQTGRPSAYTAEVAAEICRRLAEGMSLREICRAEDMPAQSTVYLWLQQHQDFSEKYAIARSAQIERMADELLEIADDGSNDWMERNQGDSAVWVTNGEAINRSRLRVDTRKWVMARLAPKKYGDKVTQELIGDPDKPIIQRIERVIVDPMAEVGVMLTAPMAVPDDVAGKVAERLKTSVAREAPNQDP